MLSELKAKSEKLIVHCDKRLIPLFKRSLSKDIIFEGSKNNINEKDYDVHIPMGSVSKYFRENLKSFSVTSKGYLKADKDRTLKIRNKLLKDKKFTKEKVLEEIYELIESVDKNSNKIHEAADILYHLIIYFEANDIKIEEVMNELKNRQK